MDAQVGVDRAGQELGAAEVDAYDASLDHAGHDTWQTTHRRNTRSTARVRGSRGSATTSWAAASRASRSPSGAAGGRSAAATAEPRRRRRLTVGRVVGYLAMGVAAWLLVSLVVFLISAQIQSAKVSDAADAQLSGGGYPLTTPEHDPRARLRRPHEGERRAGRADDRRDRAGRTRSCSCASAAAPTRSSRSCATPWSTSPATASNKINAAYAFGGPSLAIETVEQYLGIPINHLVEVNFENFPDLIDSLGGITYTGNRVISKINGGSRNGGYTLRLKAGTNELNGEQALALARTRKNDCRPQENDQSRADPPAEDHERDQGQGHLVRDLHPAAVGRRGRRRRRSARTCRARRCSG